jgi:hypothetical protein
MKIYPGLQTGRKSQIIKKLILFLLVSLVTLAVVAGCTASSTPVPSPTSSATLTSTQLPQDQRPIEVISVIEPPQDPNPGGGIVEITLKNVGVESVISLTPF